MSVRKISTASILSPSYKNSKIWDGETFPGYFESIATVTSTSDLGNGVTFSNIPQNYTHLQLRFICRAPSADNTNGLAVIRMNFNGQGGEQTTYDTHALAGNGSTASGGAALNSWRIDIGNTAGNGLTAGIMAVGIVDILDYTSTSKTKVVRTFAGCDTNSTTGEVKTLSGNWRSTPQAITTIQLWGDGGPSGGFRANSHFALYGIRGV